MLSSLTENLRNRVREWVSEHLEAIFRFYPPYLGAGIQVRSISDDFRRVVVEMPLTPLNRNYVGTHFGGSLYSMCDPFYMLILMENLGSDYIVWDKTARIDFRKPGRSTVRAVFEVSDERIEAIGRRARRDSPIEPTFEAEVVDDEGDVVAAIEKTVYVRYDPSSETSD